MARYALVIGVGENRSPLPSLSKTVGDARAIAHILRMMPVQVLIIAEIKV